MEMDHVYIELAPRAGTLRQLRAEADAYRAVKLATPNRARLFSRLSAVLAATATRARAAKLIGAGEPVTEE